MASKNEQYYKINPIIKIIARWVAIMFPAFFLYLRQCKSPCPFVAV